MRFLITFSIVLGLSVLSVNVQAAAVLEGVKPWPSGEVHYVFDAELLSDALANSNDCADREQWLNSSLAFKVCEAMDEWQYASGVVFKPAGDDSVRPLQIDKATYTAATMGYQDTRNLFSVQPTATKGQIMHEIGHVLGLMHEHQRPDRDEYLTMDPILNARIGSLVMLGTCDPIADLACRRHRDDYVNLMISQLQSLYDPCSIMHYKAAYGRDDYNEVFGERQAFALTAKGARAFTECAAKLKLRAAECIQVGQNCEITGYDADIVRRFNGTVN